MKRKLSARECAVRSCSLSKQTRRTLERRLRAKGFGKEEVSASVLAMEENGYIDENEYARAFVSDSYRIKKHGKRRIINELVLRGISREKAERAIRAYGADECEIIRSVMEKRFSDEDDRNKIIRFFAARGFDFDDIRRCIDE